MEISDYISLMALFAAISGLIYTYKTNTKKYELRTQYKSEILDWYSETVKVLINLKLKSAKEMFIENEKLTLMSTLSSQIEIGRMYFPNIERGDFGKEKEIAYQGYRNLMLDFLVFSYRILDKESLNNNDYQKLEFLQRGLTSLIYKLIDPKKMLEDVQNHTNSNFYEETSFDDFIDAPLDDLKNKMWHKVLFEK
jgi:hypothetical protein